VVGGAFQSIDCVCFCVNREEVDPELLFKVSSCWDGENASVRFLMEHIFRPLGSMTTLEECEGPKNSLLFIVELLQGQVDVEGAGVQECTAVVMFSAEVQRRGELGMYLSCHRSRGQRHQRRWYKWGRCVWYRWRGGISY